jgi:hypothetical protein
MALPGPPPNASPEICIPVPMDFNLKGPAHLLVQMMYTSKCGLQVDGSFHQIASGHLVWGPSCWRADLCMDCRWSRQWPWLVLCSGEAGRIRVE